MCAVSGTALYVAGLARRVRRHSQRVGWLARHTGHRPSAVRRPALHHAGAACPRILDPGVHVAAAIRDAARAATPSGPDRRMRLITYPYVPPTIRMTSLSSLTPLTWDLLESFPPRSVGVASLGWGGGLDTIFIGQRIDLNRFCFFFFKYHVIFDKKKPIDCQ